MRIQGAGDIGLRLREERHRLGRTLAQLAEEIGSSKSYISNLERGIISNPSVEFVSRICMALGIDLVIQGRPDEHSERRALAYESPFTLEDLVDRPEAHIGKPALRLLGRVFRDARIPVSDRLLLDRQVTALAREMQRHFGERKDCEDGKVHDAEEG